MNYYNDLDPLAQEIARQVMNESTIYYQLENSVQWRIILLEDKDNVEIWEVYFQEDETGDTFSYEVLSMNSGAFYQIEFLG